MAAIPLNWRADDPDVVERLRRLAKSILCRCSPEEIVSAGGDWRLICAWPYGDRYVLEGIWKLHGIDAVVRPQAGTRHLGFDVERTLFALVANRACAPGSKLYCHEQWLKEDAHIDGTQALKLHQLYGRCDYAPVASAFSLAVVLAKCTVNPAAFRPSANQHQLKVDSTPPRPRHKQSDDLRQVVG